MSNQILQPLMSQRRTALIGGALVAIGPISMALYTPAMPTLVEVFATTTSTIKLTLTTYFAGFAFAQLICGPLSDAFGRKPVALAFLTLYLAASLAALAAPSVEWMLVARAVQGVGAAVGIAISRAVVRDQYVGQTSARIMNTIAMILAIGPAISPTIGGLTLELLDWHAIFLAMVLFGLPLMGLVAFALPETNRAPDRSAIRPASLAKNYAMLLADMRFVRPALTIGLTLSLFYTMATMLPFVLIEHVGLSPSQFGYAMILQSGSFISGTIVTSRLLRRFDAVRLVPAGFVFMLAAAAFLAFVLPRLDPTLASVMGPVGLLAFGVAFVLPSLSTQAVAPFARNAGAASAMMGFLQMGGGLLGSLLAAALGDPLLALTTIVPAMPTAALIVYLGLRTAARPARRAAGGGVNRQISPYRRASLPPACAA